MRSKDIKNIIRFQLEKYGQPCTIKLSNGEVITSFVVTKRLWQNDKTKLEADFSMIGKNEKDYISAFLPLCLPDVRLGENDIMQLNSEEFYFVKSTTYRFGGDVLYHYCVLRRINQEDEDVFE